MNSIPWWLMVCACLPTLVCIVWLILRNVYGPIDSG